jgi:hypothetical protein
VKFLAPYDCLVTADIDGYLHFFAVTPSPRKNEHLCKVTNMNISQVGSKVNYPIRAIDFDAENNILYTGDEMGWIQRWDLTVLFAKLQEVQRTESKAAYKIQPDLTNLDELGGFMESQKKASVLQPASNDSSAFITGVDLGNVSQAGSVLKQAKVEF